VNYKAPVNQEFDWFVNVNGQFTDERAIDDRINTPYIDSSWNFDLQTGIESSEWSVVLYVENLLDDDTVTWGQNYQDFRDGMYGGNNGGEPRDETVMAFLPKPRIFGLRAGWTF